MQACREIDTVMLLSKVVTKCNWMCNFCIFLFLAYITQKFCISLTIITITLSKFLCR